MPNRSTKFRGYALDAHNYALNVAAGRILACKWVRLACERHVKDLERARGATFRYRFDLEKANEVCQFVELLQHIKGPKAGTRIVLEPWQKFILCSVFGWLLKGPGKPKRRFRRAYVEVPRGNAKSTLSAAVGLYLLAVDGEGGAEVYSAATTRDQARIVFNVAQQMAKGCAGFRSRFGVQINARNINQVSTASKFEPLSSDSWSLDGLNIHAALVDELHAHRTREVYDVLETGTGKREQSLLWAITTAGNNRAGICYEVRGYNLKVLQGVLRDDSAFGIIYTIDAEDDWTDPAVWRKANPNWGVSVMPDVVEQLVHKAMQLPSAQNNVKTKHLDVWVNADVAWMDMRAWQRQADTDLTPDQFLGEPCRVGIDLASKVDLAAVMRVFSRIRPGDPADFSDLVDQGPCELKGCESEKGEHDRYKRKSTGKMVCEGCRDGILSRGEAHYYAFGTYYLPEDRVEESHNSQYAGWAETGVITTTPGNILDFDAIEEDLKAWGSDYQVEEVAYDPFQATQFSTRMKSEGFNMIEVRPTVLNFSEPMKEIEALVLSGRLHHNGDPVLEWNISNVVGHYDKKDNIYPTKERPENKIDAAVALCMVIGRWILNAGAGSVYDKRGILTL